MNRTTPTPDASSRAPPMGWPAIDLPHLVTPLKGCPQPAPGALSGASFSTGSGPPAPPMGSRIAAGPAIPGLCGWITGERRLTTLLAPLILAEALETTRFHRGDGRTGGPTTLVTTRPCRAPHQTLSAARRIGGGPRPIPREVSLAHHGILCLDERPACTRHVLEVLRQPLAKSITEIQSPGRPRPRRARRRG